MTHQTLDTAKLYFLKARAGVYSYELHNNIDQCYKCKIFLKDTQDIRQKTVITTTKQNISTRDIYGLYIRFLNLLFGNSDSENPIFHRSFNLIYFGIIWQSEPPHELATASLHTMPRIFLVFLLNVPLSTYLKNFVIFNFNLHFFFVEAWYICLEYVCFWGLLPIHPGAHKCRAFSRKRSGEMKILERVPHIE
ncbi:hypothetical protein CR513_55442, partial [Mucuna pruriens]